jgi:hypothetical protein
MSVDPAILIHVVHIIFCVLIFSPLAAILALVIRDAIRKRGKWGINLMPGACHQCGTPLPMIRKLANWRPGNVERQDVS